MSEERNVGTDAGGTEDLDLDLDDDLSEDSIASDEPEGGDEPQPEEGEDGGREARPQPRPSREASTARALRQRAKEAEEAKIRLETELQFLRQQQQAAPRPDPAVEQARRQQELEYVQTLAPHEAAQYYATQATEGLRRQVANETAQLKDMLDRQSFASFQATNPVAKGWDQRVEQGLAELRRMGFSPTREGVFKYLFGDEALSKMQRQVARQQQQGARRVASQTTRPGSGRSTAAAPRTERGRELSEREFEEKYGNTPF